MTCDSYAVMENGYVMGGIVLALNGRQAVSGQHFKDIGVVLS
ncbi:MAG: hypothetical protein ABFD91_13980 [Anaerohalosphaeraceae bacterium]